NRTVVNQIGRQRVQRTPSPACGSPSRATAGNQPRSRLPPRSIRRTSSPTTGRSRLHSDGRASRASSIVKGSVRQRGSKWQYRFRGPERDPSTGEYPWITKGGFHTKKEAWQACREAMAEADRGRVVKPSTRTVAQFFAEWFAAIEPSIDATTWQNWKDY